MLIHIFDGSLDVMIGGGRLIVIDCVGDDRGCESVDQMRRMIGIQQYSCVMCRIG